MCKTHQLVICTLTRCFIQAVSSAQRLLSRIIQQIFCQISKVYNIFWSPAIPKTTDDQNVPSRLTSHGLLGSRTHNYSLGVPVNNSSIVPDNYTPPPSHLFVPRLSPSFLSAPYSYHSSLISSYHRFSFTLHALLSFFSFFSIFSYTRPSLSFPPSYDFCNVYLFVFVLFFLHNQWQSLFSFTNRGNIRHPSAS